MSYRDDVYVTTWQRRKRNPTNHDFCTRGLSLDDREWLHDMPDPLADERDDQLETWAAPELELFDNIAKYDNAWTLPPRTRRIGRGKPFAVEDPAQLERQRKYYADLAAKRVAQMEAFREAFQREPTVYEKRRLQTMLSDLEWEDSQPNSILREAISRAKWAADTPLEQLQNEQLARDNSAQALQGKRPDGKPRKLAPWEAEWVEDTAGRKRRVKAKRNAELDAARKALEAERAAERERQALAAAVERANAHMRQAELDRQAGEREHARQKADAVRRANASVAKQAQDECEPGTCDADTACPPGVCQRKGDRMAKAQARHQAEQQAAFERQAEAHRQAEARARAAQLNAEAERQRRNREALADIERMKAEHLAATQRRASQVVNVANQILAIMRMAPGQYRLEDFMEKTGFDRSMVLEACERLVGTGYIRKRW